MKCDAILISRVGGDLLRQPPFCLRHRNSVTYRVFSLAIFLSCLGLGLACTNQNPDQIRQKTAEETSAIKRDTKALAEGVKDGLSNKKSVDLNKASKDELTSLPGVTPPEADRIIAERPYANPHQLVSRRVVSEDEYNQIQDRVVVNR
jgi:DNA uptake protein ComE-like DNA-binding protein